LSMCDIRTCFLCLFISSSSDLRERSLLVAYTNVIFTDNSTDISNGQISLHVSIDQLISWLVFTNRHSKTNGGNSGDSVTPLDSVTQAWRTPAKPGGRMTSINVLYIVLPARKLSTKSTVKLDQTRCKCIFQEIIQHNTLTTNSSPDSSEPNKQ